MPDTDQKFDHSFNSTSFSDVVTHQPIPAVPIPPPPHPPATAEHFPALSVPGWVISNFYMACELGICQSRGHLPAFDTHVLSFSNIIYHRGFYSKHKHIGPSIKDGKKLYQFLKARFLDFMHVFFSLGCPPFF